MANLLITMRCNRSCSYCFAKEKLHSYSQLTYPMDITIQNLDKVLDFHTRSGSNALQLAGGEPTLHPKFDEILIRTLRRGMYVNLLSNALWNGEKNALFSKVPPTKLGFLLNIDHPDTYRPDEWVRVEKNLSTLQGRGNVCLSFNIFERQPKCDYIFDLVSKYGITKLRLSFSMPVAFGEVRNVYLPLEEYKALAPFVMAFVEKAESLRASVRMDNTVPICMFSPDELVELLLKEVLEPYRNFICYPAIDVGPDLSVWRCFGTSGLSNKHLDDFNSLSEIYEFYERVFKPYQVKIFPMDECYECKYAREAICQGGCIGFSIDKCIELDNYPHEITDDEILDMKPKLSDDITIRRYEVPEDTLILLHENSSVIEVHPLMKHLLDLFNGKRTIKGALELIMHKMTGIGRNGDLLDAFLTSTVSMEVIPKIRRLIDNGILTLPEVKD